MDVAILPSSGQRTLTRRGFDIEALPDFEDKYLVCNGLRLHYLDWGDVQLKPLVLLHGLHGHAHVWDTLAQDLGDSFHVLALDMRGHGDSQWALDRSYRLEDHLGDLSAFVGALGLDAFTLVGLSLGGLVSTAFVSMFPGAVDRFVIVDIGPDIPSGLLEEIKKSSETRPEDFGDLEEALEWARAGEPLADDEELRRTLEFNLAPTPEGRLRWKYDPATDTLIGPERPDGASVLWELWSAIACPTLIVRGEQSELLSTDTACQMESRAADATLVEIPAAAHVVTQDNPDAFLDAVRAFLGIA